MERARLRRVFTQKLDTPVGYVLPVKVAAYDDVDGAAWTTGPWFLRDERMYLMPGDSPMGLRLPLDSLPWVSEADFPYMIEQDPSTLRGELPVYATLAARYAPSQMAPNYSTVPTYSTAPSYAPGKAGLALGAARRAAAAAAAGTANASTAMPFVAGALPPTEATRLMQSPTGPLSRTSTSTHAQSTLQAEPADFARAPDAQESAHWITRTALCVEVRDPRRASGPKAEAVGEASSAIYVFMPPLERTRRADRHRRLPATARPTPETAQRDA